MTVYRYHSTDAGAPALSGSAGSLIAVLDACLVNGYGVGETAKPGAGWAKSFAAANKGIYRAPSGLRRYYRVNDAGTVSANGATRAHVRGSQAATDIDTQTSLFPSVALPSTEGMVIAKSNVATTDARPWHLIADGAGFYLFIEANPAYPGLCHGTYVGDFVSYGDSDPYAACIVGDITDWSPAADPRTTGNSRFSMLNMLNADVSVASICNGVIERNHTGAEGQQRAALAGPYLLPPGVSSGGQIRAGSVYQGYAMGRYPTAMADYPAAITGLVLDTAKLVYNTLLRGYLPGLYYPLSNRPFAHLTELSNLRALSGRTALALDLPANYHTNAANNAVYDGANFTGQCLVDLTGPWR